MSKIANNHLHYVLDLENTISRLSGLILYLLNNPNSIEDNYGFFLAAFNYLPKEFEMTREMKQLLLFLEDKVKDERKNP